MAPLPAVVVVDTLMPFLYPSFMRRCASVTIPAFQTATHHAPRRRLTTSTASNPSSSTPPHSPVPTTYRKKPTEPSHLDPTPDDYSITPFQDRCVISLYAGAGGHGCVSFLREKFIAEGPPNGGDGGSGGSVFIQAVRGETSLHKLARQGHVKAGRGKNGQGKGQGGERGQDYVFTVPVGTVVREIGRQDPLEEEAERLRLARRQARDRGEDYDAVAAEAMSRDKWVVYPGTMLPRDLAAGDSPAPRVRRTSMLAAMQPSSPIRLDLSQPMSKPLLLAAGAIGGLGNPHFVTRSIPRPKYATKGETGIKLQLELELKVLADVGLVGLPNAGKSTLLRALTNSRTRIGNWAFTTLQPSIGTVVLDDNKGRPALQAFEKDGTTPRTSFTIADIPGLIADAHLDKGLGISFLRHVERAAVLAFVIDLSAGDAVTALKLLWREVGEYESLRERELHAETQSRMALSQLSFHDPNAAPSLFDSNSLDTQPVAPISSKPWFVVATKADKAGTKDEFEALKAYLGGLNAGVEAHPSGKRNAWRRNVKAVPISAINAGGVDAIPRLVVDLLG